MEVGRYIQARNWPVVAGYLLFTGMMAVGYFYNVTFIQLGLKDLGERVLGLPPGVVAQQMAVLALLTCLVALVFGYDMQRWGWNSQFLRKLQMALAVVMVQTILTAIVPLVGSPAGFLIWIAFCSLALGVGVPATFSLTTDLILVRDREYVAAAITAVAYFLAAVFSSPWQIGALRARIKRLHKVSHSFAINGKKRKFDSETTPSCDTIPPELLTHISLITSLRAIPLRELTLGSARSRTNVPVGVNSAIVDSSLLTISRCPVTVLTSMSP